MRKIISIISIVFFLFPAFVSAKELPNEPVAIRVHDTKGITTSTFYPFGKNYFGRVHIATADINNDGTDEIIVGAGQQEDPLVKIFNIDGSEKFSFTAYHPSFRQGVHVAGCDLDKDGQAEIITGASNGGGPHVRIFNANTGALWNNIEFFAYEQSFLGGVNVACGNVDEDNDIEIITGPGISGGPHLKIFSSKGILKHEQFIGNMPSNSGLRVIVSDINHIQPSEIITTEEEDGQHAISILQRNKQTYQFINYIPIGDSLTNVSLSTFDFGNATEDILISHAYAKSQVDIIKTDGTQQGSFTPFTTINHGSQTIALHTPTQNLQVSVNDSGTHRMEDGQYILIDISSQTLFMLENASLKDTFLISSGLPKYETPRGLFSVTDKLPVHTYRWSYGVRDARNYVIPNVKWNLRFKKHFYIHSATWHNNFGKKMSHGCVNVHPQNAEKIFSWANIGTVVNIQD